MACSECSSIAVARPGAAPEDATRPVVWVSGEHDLATKVSLVVAIARAADPDAGDVLVDMSGVTFMDASTIGAIVGSRNRLLSRSQSLEVRAPSLPARRVLEMCGLTHLVHFSAAEPVHPAGAAVALSTWVDVRATQANRERDHDAYGTGLSEELQPSDGRRSSAAATVEADRGGP